MEKQGVVNENTPSEDPKAPQEKAAAAKSIDKLAEDHVVSRLIQKMSRRPVPSRPAGA
jgi:hypothetical protein